MLDVLRDGMRSKQTGAEVFQNGTLGPMVPTTGGDQLAQGCHYLLSCSQARVFERRSIQGLTFQWLEGRRYAVNRPVSTHSGAAKQSNDHGQHQ